jgi:excisionase family DNA binding protein
VVALLTIPEAAERLRIGVSILRRYLRRRLLPRVILPGGDQRIREQDLENFVSSRTVKAKDKP